MRDPKDTQQGQNGSEQARLTEKPKNSKPEPARKDPYLRAPNEDDDGYDPYSDRRYEPPLFERDPWN